MDWDLMDLELDDSEIRRGLALVPKQFAFGMALALTRTAALGAADTTAAAPGHFTTRTDFLTDPRRPGAWKSAPARKDSLVATVGNRNPQMELQVFGGTKEAGQALQSVPTDAGVGSTADAALRGPDDLGTLLRGGGKWAKRIVKTAGPGGFFVKTVAAFEGRTRTWGARETDPSTGIRSRKFLPGGGKAVLAEVADKAILFQKTGAQHAATRSYLGQPAGRPVFAKSPVQAIYVFRRETVLKPRLPFNELVRAAVARHWPEQADRAVTEVLWTTK